MDSAIEKVNELIAIDMGSLVEDKKGDRRERVSGPSSFMYHFHYTSIPQRKWPEEKIPVGLETLRNFNVRAKVVGPAVSTLSHIFRCVFDMRYRVCL
jgi:hypothetical protein